MDDSGDTNTVSAAAELLAALSSPTAVRREYAAAAATAAVDPVQRTDSVVRASGGARALRHPSSGAPPTLLQQQHAVHQLAEPRSRRPRSGTDVAVTTTAAAQAGPAAVSATRPLRPLPQATHARRPSQPPTQPQRVPVASGGVGTHRRASSGAAAATTATAAVFSAGGGGAIANSHRMSPLQTVLDAGGRVGARPGNGSHYAGGIGPGMGEGEGRELWNGYGNGATDARGMIAWPAEAGAVEEQAYDATGEAATDAQSQGSRPAVPASAPVVSPNALPSSSREPIAMAAPRSRGGSSSYTHPTIRPATPSVDALRAVLVPAPLPPTLSTGSSAAARSGAATAATAVGAIAAQSGAVHGDEHLSQPAPSFAAAAAGKTRRGTDASSPATAAAAGGAQADGVLSALTLELAAVVSELAAARADVASAKAAQKQLQLTTSPQQRQMQQIELQQRQGQQGPLGPSAGWAAAADGAANEGWADAVGRGGEGAGAWAEEEYWDGGDAATPATGTLRNQHPQQHHHQLLPTLGRQPQPLPQQHVQHQQRQQAQQTAFYQRFHPHPPVPGSGSHEREGHSLEPSTLGGNSSSATGAGGGYASSSNSVGGSSSRSRRASDFARAAAAAAAASATYQRQQQQRQPTRVQAMLRHSTGAPAVDASANATSNSSATGMVVGGISGLLGAASTSGMGVRVASPGAGAAHQTAPVWGRDPGAGGALPRGRDMTPVSVSPLAGSRPPAAAVPAGTGGEEMGGGRGRRGAQGTFTGAITDQAWGGVLEATAAFTNSPLAAATTTTTSATAIAHSGHPTADAGARLRAAGISSAAAAAASTTASLRAHLQQQLLRTGYVSGAAPVVHNPLSSAAVAAIDDEGAGGGAGSWDGGGDMGQDLHPAPPTHNQPQLPHAPAHQQQEQRQERPSPPKSGPPSHTPTPLSPHRAAASSSSPGGPLVPLPPAATPQTRALAAAYESSVSDLRAAYEADAASAAWRADRENASLRSANATDIESLWIAHEAEKAAAAAQAGADLAAMQAAHESFINEHFERVAAAAEEDAAAAASAHAAELASSASSHRAAVLQLSLAHSRALGDTEKEGRAAGAALAAQAAAEAALLRVRVTALEADASTLRSHIIDASANALGVPLLVGGREHGAGLLALSSLSREGAALRAETARLAALCASQRTTIAHIADARHAERTELLGLLVAAEGAHVARSAAMGAALEAQLGGAAEGGAFAFPPSSADAIFSEVMGADGSDSARNEAAGTLGAAVDAATEGLRDEITALSAQAEAGEEAAGALEARLRLLSADNEALRAAVVALSSPSDPSSGEAAGAEAAAAALAGVDLEGIAVAAMERAAASAAAAARATGPVHRDGGSEEGGDPAHPHGGAGGAGTPGRAQLPRPPHPPSGPRSPSSTAPHSQALTASPSDPYPLHHQQQLQQQQQQQQQARGASLGGGGSPQGPSPSSPPQGQARGRQPWQPGHLPPHATVGTAVPDPGAATAPAPHEVFALRVQIAGVSHELESALQQVEAARQREGARTLEAEQQSAALADSMGLLAGTASQLQATQQQLQAVQQQLQEAHTALRGREAEVSGLRAAVAERNAALLESHEEATALAFKLAAAEAAAAAGAAAAAVASPPRARPSLSDAVTQTRVVEAGDPTSGVTTRDASLPAAAAPMSPGSPAPTLQFGLSKGRGKVAEAEVTAAAAASHSAPSHIPASRELSSRFGLATSPPPAGPSLSATSIGGDAAVRAPPHSPPPEDALAAATNAPTTSAAAVASALASQQHNQHMQQLTVHLEQLTLQLQQREAEAARLSAALTDTTSRLATLSSRHAHCAPEAQAALEAASASAAAQAERGVAAARAAAEAEAEAWMGAAASRLEQLAARKEQEAAAFRAAVGALEDRLHGAETALATSRAEAEERERGAVAATSRALRAQDTGFLDREAELHSRIAEAEAAAAAAVGEGEGVRWALGAVLPLLAALEEATEQQQQGQREQGGGSNGAVVIPDLRARVAELGALAQRDPAALASRVAPLASGVSALHSRCSSLVSTLGSVTRQLAQLTEAAEAWAGERDALRLQLAERDADIAALAAMIDELQAGLDRAVGEGYGAHGAGAQSPPIVAAAASAGPGKRSAGSGGAALYPAANHPPRQTQQQQQHDQPHQQQLEQEWGQQQGKGRHAAGTATAAASDPPPSYSAPHSRGSTSATGTNASASSTAAGRKPSSRAGSSDVAAVPASDAAAAAVAGGGRGGGVPKRRFIAPSPSGDVLDASFFSGSDKAEAMSMGLLAGSGHANTGSYIGNATAEASQHGSVTDAAAAAAIGRAAEWAAPGAAQSSQRPSGGDAQQPYRRPSGADAQQPSRRPSGADAQQPQPQQQQQRRPSIPVSPTPSAGAPAPRRVSQRLILNEGGDAAMPAGPPLFRQGESQGQRGEGDRQGQGQQGVAGTASGPPVSMPSAEIAPAAGSRAPSRRGSSAAATAPAAGYGGGITAPLLSPPSHQFPSAPAAGDAPPALPRAPTPLITSMGLSPLAPSPPPTSSTTPLHGTPPLGSHTPDSPRPAPEVPATHTPTNGVLLSRQHLAQRARLHSLLMSAGSALSSVWALSPQGGPGGAGSGGSVMLGDEPSPFAATPPSQPPAYAHHTGGSGGGVDDTFRGDAFAAASAAAGAVGAAGSFGSVSISSPPAPTPTERAVGGDARTPSIPLGDPLGQSQLLQFISPTSTVFGGLAFEDTAGATGPPVPGGGSRAGGGGLSDEEASHAGHITSSAAAAVAVYPPQFQVPRGAVGAGLPEAPSMPPPTGPPSRRPSSVVPPSGDRLSRRQSTVVTTAAAAAGAAIPAAAPVREVPSAQLSQPSSLSPPSLPPLSSLLLVSRLPQGASTTAPATVASSGGHGAGTVSSTLPLPSVDAHALYSQQGVDAHALYRQQGVDAHALYSQQGIPAEAAAPLPRAEQAFPEVQQGARKRSRSVAAPRRGSSAAGVPTAPVDDPEQRGAIPGEPHPPSAVEGIYLTAASGAPSYELPLSSHPSPPAPHAHHPTSFSAESPPPATRSRPLTTDPGAFLPSDTKQPMARASAAAAGAMPDAGALGPLPSPSTLGDSAVSEGDSRDSAALLFGEAGDTSTSLQDDAASPRVPYHTSGALQVVSSLLPAVEAAANEMSALFRLAAAGGAESLWGVPSAPNSRPPSVSESMAAPKSRSDGVNELLAALAAYSDDGAVGGDGGSSGPTQGYGVVPLPAAAGDPLRGGGEDAAATAHATSSQGENGTLSAAAAGVWVGVGRSRSGSDSSESL